MTSTENSSNVTEDHYQIANCLFGRLDACASLQKDLVNAIASYSYKGCYEEDTGLVAKSSILLIDCARTEGTLMRCLTSWSCFREKKLDPRGSLEFIQQRNYLSSGEVSCEKRPELLYLPALLQVSPVTLGGAEEKRVGHFDKHHTCS